MQINDILRDSSVFRYVIGLSQSWGKLMDKLYIIILYSNIFLMGSPHGLMDSELEIYKITLQVPLNLY